MHAASRMSNIVRIQRGLDERVKVRRGRSQAKGSFDLIVRVVEVQDDDEEAIEDEAIDIQIGDQADEDMTHRRELLLPPGMEGATGEATDFVATSGSRLSKYLLGRRLGEGSFGVVFSARDTALDREVAIKLLTSQHVYDPQMLSRFLQEATAAARIRHPGIVTMFDCGHADGTAFIAMELLQGETLTDRLARSGRLTPETAIEIVRQVASALDAAHAAGVVHRDLKPDNIFLVPDPAVPTGERVKILDFGLAKLRHQVSSSHTHARIVFGTPRYMSPEQTRSAAKADHRSDIYALGCILFELVCGRPPFDGELNDVVDMHQRLRPPPARALVPSLHAKLDRLITDMLAKDPDDRPQTMGAVQRALQEVGAIAPGAAATMLPTITTDIAQDMWMTPKSALVPEPSRVRAMGTPMPPLAALERSDFSGSTNRTDGRSPSQTGSAVEGRRGSIEHTLPWGKLDLDPEIEIIMTSAPMPIPMNLMPTPLTSIRASSQPGHASIDVTPATVLHAPGDARPLPPIQPAIMLRMPGDGYLEAAGTLGIAKRRRIGIITAVSATLIAAAVLATLALVQSHARAATTPVAAPAHAAGATGR